MACQILCTKAKEVLHKASEPKFDLYTDKIHDKKYANTGSEWDHCSPKCNVYKYNYFDDFEWNVKSLHLKNDSEWR